MQIHKRGSRDNAVLDSNVTQYKGLYLVGNQRTSYSFPERCMLAAVTCRLSNKCTQFETFISKLIKAVISTCLLSNLEFQF